MKQNAQQGGEIVSKQDIRKEFSRKRKVLLLQQEDLITKHCNSCSGHSGNDSINGQCRGCDILSQLNVIGETLENLSKVKKEQLQSAHAIKLTKEKEPDVVPVYKMPLPIKTVELKGEEDVSTLTVDRYQDLKVKGLSDSKIMKEFGMNNQSFYVWKKEQGLVKSKTKNETLAKSSSVSSEIASVELEKLRKELKSARDVAKDALDKMVALSDEKEELSKRLDEALQTIAALENVKVENEKLSSELQAALYEQKSLQNQLEIAQRSNDNHAPNRRTERLTQLSHLLMAEILEMSN